MSEECPVCHTSEDLEKCGYCYDCCPCENYNHDDRCKIESCKCFKLDYSDCCCFHHTTYGELREGFCPECYLDTGNNLCKGCGKCNSCCCCRNYVKDLMKEYGQPEKKDPIAQWKGDDFDNLCSAAQEDNNYEVLTEIKRRYNYLFELMEHDRIAIGLCCRNIYEFHDKICYCDTPIRKVDGLNRYCSEHLKHFLCRIEGCGRLCVKWEKEEHTLCQKHSDELEAKYEEEKRIENECLDKFHERIRVIKVEHWPKTKDECFETIKELILLMKEYKLSKYNCGIEDIVKDLTDLAITL